MSVTVLKNANSPYMGAFTLTQGQSSSHGGYDMVGIDSKIIHSCANATVIHVGWQNPNNHSEGFGYYIATKDDKPGSDGVYKIRYYGHLTENSAKVKVNDKVKITDELGVEGYTGYTIPSGPNGSHCHYEVRAAFYKGAKVYDLVAETGIPNVANKTYDDGYRPNSSSNTTVKKKTIEVEIKQGGVTYSGTLTEK